jgi:hypothetical protein
MSQHEDSSLDLPSSQPALFSEQEWEELHHSDIGAGRAIVVLIGSIFTIGFFLYGTIAWIVS